MTQPIGLDFKNMNHISLSVHHVTGVYKRTCLVLKSQNKNVLNLLNNRSLRVRITK